MTAIVEPVARLIEAFARLPGIGPKTAQRLTYFLLRAPDARPAPWPPHWWPCGTRSSSATCASNISTGPRCPICLDPERDDTRLCVVEEPLDVLALERTGAFRGRYHVLLGAISPMDGIGPDRLRIRPLLDRVAERCNAGDPFAEVVLATNPTLEGEATAMYLAERLAGDVRAITRIARGIPVGGDLEYADEVTLVRAMQGRREFEPGRDR